MPKVIINENICKGCELCIGVCPKKILILAKDKLNAKGYHPSTVTDMEKCTGCAACAMMCPDVAITVER